MNNFNKIVSFIWQVAELLRGPYRPNQYKDVMLPLTVLRRLDCVLLPTKQKILDKIKNLKGGKIKNIDPILNKVCKLKFHNKSPFTFEKLKADPDNISANLTHYIKGFSESARKIIEHFKFETQMATLEKYNRLYKVVSKFCDIDLHPNTVSNIEMGYIFEELVRRFNEASNEEAGAHFTPREVIHLMTDLIFSPDNDSLTKKGIIKTLFDPACGTGGMLSVSGDYIRELNPQAHLVVSGQDYNPQAYAICGSDMMIKGEEIRNIRFGNSWIEDQFSGKKFDYMLANPPFGVEWKNEQDFIKKEHSQQVYAGRFGAGLPRISDGSLLFLQHMISKRKSPKEGGTRMAIVFNGSPLFTGSAGSGESEIRRWIIEHDWLEAIVALPDQLFYNTGIHTYLWILTNRKVKERRKKIQLINAVSFFTKMRKSLGKKRNEISKDQINQIVKLYGEFKENKFVRIFESKDFGYRRITVERPLKLNFQVNEERLTILKETQAFKNLTKSKKRKSTKEGEQEIKKGQELQKAILSVLVDLKSDTVVKNRKDFIVLLKEAFQKARISVSASVFKAILQALSERDDTADICHSTKGDMEPDSDLRDYENVPLKQDIKDYFKKEVLPHVPKAWIDESKTKTGYEINFNRYFYKYTPPRPLNEIEKDLKNTESEIANMLSEVLK